MEKIVLRFKRDLYSKDSVMKAAYRFVDRCYIYLDLNDDEYLVELIGKGKAGLENIPFEFENEILAQAVRHIVYKQTHILREVLMARAMASTITGDITGGMPQEETNDVEALEDILMDWFEKNEK